MNVKIGASHAGISVGEDGASHQCLEDLALMRMIPGMVVMCPADDTEARKAVKAADSAWRQLLRQRTCWLSDGIDAEAVNICTIGLLDRFIHRTDWLQDSEGS